MLRCFFPLCLNSDVFSSESSTSSSNISSNGNISPSVDRPATKSTFSGPDLAASGESSVLCSSNKLSSSSSAPEAAWRQDRVSTPLSKTATPMVTSSICHNAKQHH